jgi:hypothetical protein
VCHCVHDDNSGRKNYHWRLQNNLSIFNCAWKQTAQIVPSPQSLFQFGAIASVTASNQPGRLLFHPDGPEMASSKSWKENHLPSHIIPVWNHNASHKMLPSLKSFPSSSYF